MDEYINRESLKERFRKINVIGRDGIIKRIDEEPCADVAEVRHGYWIEEEKEVEFYSCIDKQTFYKCSLCGRYEEKAEPYCNCGAKMDEK